MFQREGSQLALRFRLIGSLILKQQLLKYLSILFLGEDWEMGIPVCSLCTGLVIGHLKAILFFFCYHLTEPVNTRLTSHQSQALKRCVLWVADIKSVAQMYIHKLLETLITWGRSEGEYEDGTCWSSCLW